MELEIDGQFFDSLVEFSGVLGDSVFHFVLDVEGTDNVVLVGGGHTCASMFLSGK